MLPPRTSATRVRIAGARLACAAIAAALASLAIPPATALAAAKPDNVGAKRITFYFGLERPEATAVSRFYAATTPGSSSYRHFESPPALAKQLGATRKTREAFRKEVKRLGPGLKVSVDPSRVFARVSGTRAQLQRAFGEPIHKQVDNDPNSVAFVVEGGRLRLPKRLKSLTREVVPIYVRGLPNNAGAVPQSDAQRQDPPADGPTNEGTFSGCAAARATGGYSFDQLRTAYGIDPQPAGAGASVALMNVGEGIKRSDVAANGDCFGLGPISTRTLISDGQLRKFPLASPAEPQEDVALARALAPAAGHLTFTQAWVVPDLWFIAPAQLLDAKRTPDTFSISYAECEYDVVGAGGTPSTKGGAALMDSMLLRLGLAGTATFASAGDDGSTCDGSNRPGVSWPSSSPFATSVGGTRLTLDPANARVDEVVWNDVPYLGSSGGGGAGGGGSASATPLPPYQSGLPGAAGERLTPDVSAHASMFPGYPVNFAGTWLADAGTSASSPLLAGAFARLSANERAAGRPPLGPVNGLLYALEKSSPASFFDVTQGNNAFEPKVPGEQAGPGYDLASGLGVPRFDRIAAELPPPAG
ncbi:MAG: hypothetical protein U0R24_10460 [Solirubrobacterales bacterium]